MTKYDTIEDWKSDMIKFEKNPNDMVFLEAIKSRIQNSSEEIQEEVREHTLAALFEKEPIKAMKYHASLRPNKLLVVKNEKDPFFEA